MLLTLEIMLEWMLWYYAKHKSVYVPIFWILNESGPYQFIGHDERNSCWGQQTHWRNNPISLFLTSPIHVGPEAWY